MAFQSLQLAVSDRRGAGLELRSLPDLWGYSKLEIEGSDTQLRNKTPHPWCTGTLPLHCTSDASILCLIVCLIRCRRMPLVGIVPLHIVHR